MPSKGAIARDEYDRPVRLAGYSDFVPSPTNHDPLHIQLPGAWLKAQRCPEHGLLYTHVRAQWKRHPLAARLWVVAVQFVCPVQHIWEEYIRPAN